MATGTFVAYYRVSTKKQDLGIPAQKDAVRRFLNGGDWSLIAELEEKESGRNNDRPQLKEALRLCRNRGAKLVIAKLDRLGRDAAYVLNLLKDSGVEFVIVDMPHASRLTVGIHAVVAEDEADRISERTKAALAAAKVRGVKLGGWRGKPISSKAAEASAKARGDAADARAADLATAVAKIKECGVTSLVGIAAELEKAGERTPGGKDKWSAVQVSRLLKRIAA